MKGPAQVLKLLLAQPVAISGRIARVIGSPIALDGEYKFSWTSCMASRQINPEFGAADLRHNLDSLTLSASNTSASKSFMGSFVNSPWDNILPPELAY